MDAALSKNGLSAVNVKVAFAPAFECFDSMRFGIRQDQLYCRFLRSCPQGNDLRTQAQLVQVIRPLKHHLAPLFQKLGPVIGHAQRA